MFILRQIGAKLAFGQVSRLAAASRFPYRLQDVDPKYKLYVPDGKVLSQAGYLAASGSTSLALPESYSGSPGGRPLYVALKVNDKAKLTVVSPDHGTSNFLLMATNGSVSGAHDGVIIWAGTVTSLTLTAASTATNLLFEAFMFELPDLTVSTSYRDGVRALGVTT